MFCLTRRKVFINRFIVDFIFLESPKDSGKKKVKFETSSDSSGDDFEMVGSAKNDVVIKNDAQAKRFGISLFLILFMSCLLRV